VVCVLMLLLLLLLLLLLVLLVVLVLVLPQRCPVCQRLQQLPRGRELPVHRHAGTRACAGGVTAAGHAGCGGGTETCRASLRCGDCRQGAGLGIAMAVAQAPLVIASHCAQRHMPHGERHTVT
jgi:hypothetical protein